MTDDKGKIRCKLMMTHTYMQELLKFVWPFEFIRSPSLFAASHTMQELDILGASAFA
jgi:hypothetical protein